MARWPPLAQHHSLEAILEQEKRDDKDREETRELTTA
jgi:hypothetical protein